MNALDSLGKSSFILGHSKFWEEHFQSLLSLVKDYVVNICKARCKERNYYDNDSSYSLSPQLGI